MVLVTGVSGLLGASVARAACRRGYPVVGVYYEHPVAPGLNTRRADLAGSDSSRQLVADLKPALIVHCAARTDVDWCEDHSNETWRMNFEATRRLARAAGESKARFIYISTDSVFDGERGNYAESELPAPLNVYARSKLAGERAAQEELADALIVRTNFYGRTLRPRRNLAEWMLHKLESGEPFAGFADIIFTPMLVSDLSEALLDLAASDAAGIYHVAGGEACSKYEFGVQLARTFGLDERLIHPETQSHGALRAPRPKNTSLDTRRVEEKLGRRMPGIHEGLLRFRAELVQAGWPGCPGNGETER